MSTAADFVGRNCPLCGATDSIETDDVMGEAACTECAQVIVMGLEENVSTRFLKDATFEDADRHAASDPNAATAWSSVTGTHSTGLTRREASAAARGARVGAVPNKAVVSQEEEFRKVRLHPTLVSRIEVLAKLSRRPEELLVPRALALARHFIGVRRARGVNVDKMRDTAAACFVLAAEQQETPVPLAELRGIDPSLKNVEQRQDEIISETGRTQEFEALRRHSAAHLIRYYIRLMHLQRSAYETAAVAIYDILRSLGQSHTDLAQLVESERVAAAVLLARTTPSTVLHWKDRPPYHTEDHPSLEAVYEGFAANAQLPASRIHRIMQLVHSKLPALQRDFPSVWKNVNDRNTHRPLVPASTNPFPMTNSSASVKPQLGQKRERSPIQE